MPKARAQYWTIHYKTFNRITGNMSYSSYKLRLILAINPELDCHYTPPGLRFLNQLPKIAIAKPLPNYTIRYRGTCVNNLPRITT